MLSTFELLLGLTRHLDAYESGPARTALGQLEFVGRLLELAVRLRGSNVSSAARVLAIANDAAIPHYHLVRQYLPLLEQLGWAQARLQDGTLQLVAETVPPTHELVSTADRLLDMVLATPLERAALAVLATTTRLPSTRQVLVDSLSDLHSEEDIDRALEHLGALALVAQAQSADGVVVYFNPNIWRTSQDLVSAALRMEDGRVRQHVLALVEEISGRPGMPQQHVTSVETRWIDFAVRHGLVQRSLVVTTGGQEQAFLFPASLGSTTFGTSADADPTGNVRQLIGSMVYAATFASNRLYAPRLFLQRLLERGEAGNVPAIGTDYPMLETAGVVRVEPTSWAYKLVLLQADVAEEALRHLEDPEGGLPGDADLRAQERYVQPERARAQLARPAGAVPSIAADLLAALRQTVSDRDFRR